MKTKPVIVGGRDVKNCPKTDCIHHPVNRGNGECGCIAGEWEMYEQIEFDHIVYTIQPTDSVAGVARRFGVDLHELVKLNPQVCTTGPQAGIKIKIPVGHLEMVPEILPEIGNDDPGVQEERVARFKLKLPNGELYQFEEMVAVE